MRVFTVATGRLRISAQSSTEFSWKYTRSRISRSAAVSFIKAARISSLRFVFCKVISRLSALSAAVVSICFWMASGNPRFYGWFHRAERWASSCGSPDDNARTRTTYAKASGGIVLCES